MDGVVTDFLEVLLFAGLTTAGVGVASVLARVAFLICTGQ